MLSVVRIIGVYARVLCEWSGGAPSYCILVCCSLPLCMYVRMYEVCSSILQAAEVASQQAPSCEPLMRTTVPDLTTAGRLQHSTKRLGFHNCLKPPLRLQNISVLKCPAASATAHLTGQSVLSCQCQATVVAVVVCLLPKRFLDRLGSMNLLYHACLAAGRQFAVHVRLCVCLW